MNRQARHAHFLRGGPFFRSGRLTTSRQYVSEFLISMRIFPASFVESAGISYHAPSQDREAAWLRNGLAIELGATSRCGSHARRDSKGTQRMSVRLWIIIAMLAAFSLIAGCGKKKERVVIYKDGAAPQREYDDVEIEYDDDDYDDDEDVEVHIERRHVCTRACNHYWNGSRIIVLRNHVHGPGCGHVWQDRYWVRGPRRVVRTQHVCTRACNHYWNGSRIIEVRGHRHGPGCGHSWGGSYWIVASQPRRSTVIRKGPPVATSRHVCTRSCSHYWNGSRIIEVRGHRHGPHCGHSWNGTYWVVVGGRGGTTVIPKGGRRIR